MHLASPIRPAPSLAFTGAAQRAAGLASVDQVVARQARFRVDGSGPLSQRRITPVTTGAAAMLAKSPAAADAVRGVLQLVEHVAGGPAASSTVDLNGVAFSTSAKGLAANTWRAHLDDDTTFKNGLARLPASRRDGVLQQLWQRTTSETSGMLANVTSGWLNVGPGTSNALLARAGATAATPVTQQQLADSIRILLHESVHAVDTKPANLPSKAMHGVWESLAEARTMTLPQLQAARRTLGLDGAVPDAALEQSLRHRPYAAAERALAGVLRTAGIEPGSAAADQVYRSSARDAVELLTNRVAERTGYSRSDARTAIATAFAESMPHAH